MTVAALSHELCRPRRRIITRVTTTRHLFSISPRSQSSPTLAGRMSFIPKCAFLALLVYCVHCKVIDVGNVVLPSESVTTGATSTGFDDKTTDSGELTTDNPQLIVAYGVAVAPDLGCEEGFKRDTRGQCREEA